VRVADLSITSGSQPRRGILVGSEFLALPLGALTPPFSSISISPSFSARAYFFFSPFSPAHLILCGRSYRRLAPPPSRRFLLTKRFVPSRLDQDLLSLPVAQVPMQRRSPERAPISFPPFPLAAEFRNLGASLHSARLPDPNTLLSSPCVYD